MNWVDIILVIFIAFGVWQGFWHGFMTLLFQIVSLIAAIFIALWSLPKVGHWMETQLQIPVSYARPLSLGIIYLIASTVLTFAGSILTKLFAPILQANPLNRIAGMVLGALRQIVIGGVVVTLLATLPLPQEVKAMVNQSKIAKPLIALTLKLEQTLSQKLGYDDLQSIAYNTIGKDQSTTVGLNYQVSDPKTDEAGEVTMLFLTNEIRKKQGVGELKVNMALRGVAQAHAKDMLARGYFSHISPQGDDVAKRAQKAGIAFTVIGENLASAPTVAMAQAGLLASKGHRDNILNPEFNQVGIGVLDAGIHGKMIVEVFAKLQ